MFANTNSHPTTEKIILHNRKYGLVPGRTSTPKVITIIIIFTEFQQLEMWFDTGTNCI